MTYKLSVCLIVFLLMQFFQMLFAQHKHGKTKGAFECIPGLHFAGPSGPMRQLLIQHQFNATTSDWFGGTSNHPEIQHSGLSARFSYAHAVGHKSKIGILYGLSNFGTAFGAKTTMNNVYDLSLKLTSQQFVLFYEYELFRFLSLKLGPALSINACRQIGFDIILQDKTVQTAPGILTGVKLLFYDGSAVYFGAQADYLWLMKSNIGPFKAIGFSNETVEFPESQLRYNHMGIGLLVGVHLFKSEK